ncbi:MAG: hypothetical protein Q4F83_12985 [Eubacteriales bacterium]|nr:hypothetical protein [Eubacteriales bacterium]
MDAGCRFSHPLAGKNGKKLGCRDDTAISACGTMLFGREPIDVCVCVEDRQVLFYRDEATQALLAQRDYLVHLENAAESFDTWLFLTVHKPSSYGSG